MFVIGNFINALANLINFGIVGFWSFDGAVMLPFLQTQFGIGNAVGGYIVGIGKLMMRYALPDVFVLMIVGTIPDYVQGGIKLTWALRGKHASA